MRNKLKFEIKAYRSVPSAFQKEIKKLSKMCFDKKRTPEEQLEHDDQICSDKDCFAMVLALENKEVIGKIRVLKRSIDFKNKKIILGGIGGVCTREDKRGQGVAAAMLKVAMKELKKACCEVAYLNANPEKGPKFYGPFGFVFLKKQYTLLGRSGKRYFEDCGMVAPVNSKAVFAEIIADENPFDIGVGNW